jgi:peptide/nickel transport system permease protein
MITYITKRMLQMPITLIGLFTLVFLALHIMPGDPVAAYLGDIATPESITQMRSAFGLDKPLHEQYLDTIIGIFSGNLGRSFVSRRDVAREIGAVFPSTLYLAFAALLISTILGISAGVIAAFHLNKLIDHFVMILATLGVSMPVFWAGLLLIYIFSYKLRLFPVAGVTASQDVVSQMRALVLPATSIGLLFTGVVARMTRSSMAEVLNLDFVRTARAKGIGEARTVIKHGLRNALIPIVTVVGINVGLLLAGTVLAETVFARPGIGKLLVHSVLAADYPMVQGIVLLIGLIYLAVNAIIDLVYTFLDPRIRFG